MAPNKHKQKQKALAAKKKAYNNKNNSNKTTWIAIGVIVTIVIVFAAVAGSGILGNHGINSPTPSPAPTLIPSSSDPYANATEVLLKTSMGNITVALRNDMPITTGNFIKCVNDGIYTNSTFHRVMAGFMIQGGEPGNGQTVASIPDEFTNTNHNYNGTIAMANAGKNTGTSQFFINVDNNNLKYAQDGSPFDNNYVAFGKVTSGMDVVMAISKVSVNTNDNYRPLQDVTILSASIVP